MPFAMQNKTIGAGSALSRLQRGVGSRWKAEDEEEAAGKAKAGGVEQDSGRDPSGAALGTRRFVVTSRDYRLEISAGLAVAGR